MVMLQNRWEGSWNYYKVNEPYVCARNYSDINYIHFNILDYQLLIIKTTNIHYIFTMFTFAQSVPAYDYVLPWL